MVLPSGNDILAAAAVIGVKKTKKQKEEIAELKAEIERLKNAKVAETD